MTAGPPDLRMSTDPARRGPALADALIAGAYLVVFVGFSLLLLREKAIYLPWFSGSGFGPLNLTIAIQLELTSRASLALVVLSAAALAVRRTRPRASFIAMTGLCVVQVMLGEPVSLWNVAAAASFFSAAAYTSRAFSFGALVLASFANLAMWVLGTDVLGRLGDLPSVVGILSTARGVLFIATFGLLALIWTFGDQVRAARERFRFERERAVGIERQRSAEGRAALMAERQRIARELHDVVAHGLSVMVVQADGALYAAAEHPDAPREALAVIASTGRESLTEMRRLLGVLRDEHDGSGLAPQPEVSSIPELVDGFRRAGLPVDLAIEGLSRPLPPAVGLAAYRVVQEALTNVLKHAGRPPVRVRLVFGLQAVRVEVENDAGEPPPVRDHAQPGLGLVGMRERVDLVGGTVAARPTATGGFLVSAQIPLAGAWR
jgi:signal transduction histidine kinase